jgi:hypothetical protein
MSFANKVWKLSCVRVFFCLICIHSQRCLSLYQ